MFKLTLFGNSTKSGNPTSGNPTKRDRQAFSKQTLAKHARTRDAIITNSVCPYCAVGCATHIHTKAGEVIDIEGNPDSPVNEGTLCPKGANIFQLHHNPHRVKHVMWRAPFSDKWEQKPLEWAMDRIATLTKQTRDAGWREKNADGKYVNAVMNMGSLGGATLDNEENYLIKKLFSAGLGIVSVENQARI